MTTNYHELASSGIRELQPYQPGKPIDELQRELGISDIIKLASNENPLGPSAKVAPAIEAALSELGRYPDGSAYNLKQKLAGVLGVAPDNLTMGNGSNDVLELLARVYLRPGLEAICSQHSFVVYPLATKVTGADLKIIPARNFSQDLEATLDAVSDKTRIVFIANPNNPTGTWIDEASLTSFLDQLADDVIVVLDANLFQGLWPGRVTNGLLGQSPGYCGHDEPGTPAL